MQRQHSRGRIALAAALAIAAGASLRALWLLRDLALLGPDSLPLVRAAGGSLGEVVRGLAAPLMGPELEAAYYRPVLHLSFALDRALHGLAPFGYHATDALVFGACGLALFHAARRLGAGDAGALAALLLFVLHPVQLAVVPAPARRAEGLCLLFTLLAVAAQARAARAGSRGALAPALLAGLAMGSKEAGFVAPAVCAVAALVHGRAPRGWPRGRETARALVPHLAVVAAMLLWRLHLLGGIVGERPLRSEGLLPGALAMLLRVLEQSVSARAVLPDASLPGLALATALAAAAVLAVRRGGSGRSWRAVVVGASLPVLLAPVYAVGVILQPWYLLLPAAGACLALGALADRLAAALRDAGPALRPRPLVAAAGLAALAALGLDLARDSLLVGRHADWARASLAMDRYLERVSETLRDAAPGERVALPPPPILVRSRAGRRLRGVVVLSPYTVQAFADLAFPRRRVRVVGPGEAPGATGPDEIVLTLGARRGAEGGDAPLPAEPAGRDGPPGRPNVVILVSDDVGYADLGFQGSGEIATPRLDRLAAEGVRFTDAYVSAPLCAPSRAGLLTGRDGNRYGYTSTTGTFQQQMRRHVGVPESEVLLSSVLAASGYATAAVGKWHLGVQPRYRPRARGFERFFGVLAGAHAYFDWGPGIFGPVFRDGSPVRGDAYLTDVFGREAAAFVRERADAAEPFLLYAAFTAIHGPLEAPEPALARYAHLEPPARRLVAAMTTELDRAVGRILDALRETGAWRDTLVVFVNDNGGLEPISSNAPLRAGKGSLYEGGIRVPMVLRWPARLPPGVYEQPVTALDVFPTVVSATGSDPPAAALDGVDLLPHLEGREAAAPHEALFWRIGEQQAIRRGRWKLVRAREGPGTPVSDDALYDLVADVGESHDLADRRPARAASLRAELDAWLATLGPAEPSWRREPASGPQGM